MDGWMLRSVTVSQTNGTNPADTVKIPETLPAHVNAHVHDVHDDSLCTPQV